MRLSYFARHTALKAGFVLLLSAAVLASIWLPVYRAVLVGWNTGVLLYLVMALTIACRMSPEAIRQNAEELDEGRAAVTIGSVLAVLLPMGGVVMELSGPHRSGWSAPIAGVTIMLSWAFIHVLFAHRYVHEHALRGGLDFPGDDEDDPDFIECLYLAFTIGMAMQVSDVTTRSRAMRRLVLFHALLAFVFNTLVLAAAVNLAAGLAA
jgi:uncharacterized membrane protein